MSCVVSDKNYKMLQKYVGQSQLGQCFDVTSIMWRNISGVKQKTAGEKPRAVYVHCLVHLLNLALYDSARNIPTFRNMIEYTKSDVSMIRSSPNRCAILSNLCPLCPTRSARPQETNL